MSNRAWVTLATNDSYGLGALVLAYSLRRAGTVHPAVVLTTPSVTDAMKERLRSAFAEVVTVDVLDSRDAAHLALLQRPELGITFTKIHCWSLTQYEKCVFLDADTLILQNCDELFEREELSAAPDVGWPDCFNSGVFVYKPSNETFEALIRFAQERGSFDGGDQGLLNSFFSDWAHADISKHLPFLYNVTSAAFYSYLPALQHFGQDLKIIHFIGANKPWLQHYNWESRSVDAPSHLQGFLQLWWDIFASTVHPHLDTNMSGVAGNLARVTPNDPGSQREAIDELSRRQGWEAGNIDYMGADSFDNIWAKISQTLNQPRTSPPRKEPTPPKQASPPRKDPTPPPASVAQEEPALPDSAPAETVPTATPAEPISAPVEPAPATAEVPVETAPLSSEPPVAPVETTPALSDNAPAPAETTATPVESAPETAIVADTDSSPKTEFEPAASVPESVVVAESAALTPSAAAPADAVVSRPQEEIPASVEEILKAAVDVPAESAPISADPPPVSAEPAAAVAESTPTPSEPAPALTESTPAPTASTPTPSEPAPSELAPVSETTPAPSETTPAPSETAPAPSETALTSTETTPAPLEIATAHSETAPAPSELAPAPSETVSTSSEPKTVPEPIEPTTAITESLPEPVLAALPPEPLIDSSATAATISIDSNVELAKEALPSTESIPAGESEPELKVVEAKEIPLPATPPSTPKTEGTPELIAEAVSLAEEAKAADCAVTPEKNLEQLSFSTATDSPPLANTPAKEDAPSTPAAKSTEEAAQETRL